MHTTHLSSKEEVFLKIFVTEIVLTTHTIRNPQVKHTNKETTGTSQHKRLTSVSWCSPVVSLHPPVGWGRCSTWGHRTERRTCWLLRSWVCCSTAWQAAAGRCRSHSHFHCRYQLRPLLPLHYYLILKVYNTHVYRLVPAMSVGAQTEIKKDTFTC